MYDINSNILQKTGVTAAQLDAAMKKIRQDHRLSPAIPAMIAAEDKWGINALWIAAHAATETGWGHSMIAITKNNLFGYNAIDSNPGQADKYNSQAQSVEFYAAFIAKHYLHPDGMYYNGATPHGVMVRYASAGDKAANTIVDIMNMLHERIGTAKPPAPSVPVKKPAPKPEAAKPEEPKPAPDPQPTPEQVQETVESVESDDTKKKSQSSEESESNQSGK